MLIQLQSSSQIKTRKVCIFLLLYVLFMSFLILAKDFISQRKVGRGWGGVRGYYSNHLFNPNVLTDRKHIFNQNFHESLTKNFFVSGVYFKVDSEGSKTEIPPIKKNRKQRSRYFTPVIGQMVGVSPMFSEFILLQVLPEPCKKRCL